MSGPRPCRVISRSNVADGSVLLEVIVGIALLAVLSTALVSFHNTATLSAERVQVRAAAVALVRDQLEIRLAMSTHEAGGDLGDATTALAVTPMVIALTDERCGAGVAELPGVQVHSGATDVTLSGVIGSRSRSSISRDEVVPRGVVLLGPPGTIDAVASDVMIGLVGSEARRVLLDRGCGRLGALTPGRHVLTPALDSTTVLIDTTHRTAGESPLSLSALERPVRRTWDVLPAATLSVDIGTNGARLPDVVSTGALRWSVRGDDLRDMRDLGDSRPVRPGRVIAVVTACSNPETPASTRAVDLPIGGAASALVQLAMVTVVGVSDWPDETLILARTSVCADGSDLRPTMRWDGALFDGMRIALPHGEWEGRIQTAAGLRITSPVRFPASDLNTTVSLS